MNIEFKCLRQFTPGMRPAAIDTGALWVIEDAMDFAFADLINRRQQSINVDINVVPGLVCQSVLHHYPPSLSVAQASLSIVGLKKRQSLPATLRAAWFCSTLAGNERRWIMQVNDRVTVKTDGGPRRSGVVLAIESFSEGTMYLVSLEDYPLGIWFFNEIGHPDGIFVEKEIS
ncbi:TPA: protein DsrB [Klebsiella quasipneumoniae subsp. quasipneumoniae]|nr:hypothetical protein B6I39_03790 [Klebsiella quasipneumoniae]HBW2224404.1 protein DsrB [Klebsiella quasipneumoniae subsp. quasipneumoniae]